MLAYTLSLYMNMSQQKMQFEYFCNINDGFMLFEMQPGIYQ